MKAITSRIKLMNQEATSCDLGDGCFGKAEVEECYRDPTKFAQKANIVVATYSLQAGVSLESHFQVPDPFL